MAMDIAGNAPINQLQAFGDTDRQAIEGLRQAIEQLAGGLSDLLELYKSTAVLETDDDPAILELSGRVEKLEQGLADCSAKMGRVDGFQEKIVGFEASLAVNRDHDAEHGRRLQTIEEEIMNAVARLGRLERSLRMNGIPIVG
jgi:hypothetical protein